MNRTTAMLAWPVRSGVRTLVFWLQEVNDNVADFAALAAEDDGSHG
jgi:hypothetical protein